MKLFRKLTALVLAGSLALGGVVSASACTGVYIGKDCTTDGKAYFGRSEDIANYLNKIFTIHPAEDHEPGTFYPMIENFTTPYPAHTLRYSVLKDTPKNNTNYGDDASYQEECYAEAGVNELGVSMSATVTLGSNSKALNADPYVKDRRQVAVNDAIDPNVTSAGVSEMSMTTIVLSQATSARNACEIFAGLIDAYGSQESNGIMFSDKDEVWYLESHCGHQYAAVKMPTDKILISPNMSIMSEVDVTDTENVIVSDGLVSVAKENGFLVTGDSGQINVMKTWGNNAKDDAPQNSRFYQGVAYFSQAEAAKYNISGNGNNWWDWSITGPYSMYVEPDHLVTPTEAIRFLGTQGEGTALDSSINKNVYAIGNSGQAACHIFELGSGMQSGLLTVEWVAMASADFGLFLPYYAGMLDKTPEVYLDEAAAATKDQWGTPNSYPTEGSDSIFWTMCELENICREDRAKYNAVREYFAQYQNALADQQAAVSAGMAKVFAYSPELAGKKAEQLSKVVTADAYDMLRSVLTEMRAFKAGGAEGDFVPTAMTNHVMPDYTWDRIGGVPDFTSVLNQFIEEAQKFVDDGTVDGLVESVKKVYLDTLAKAKEVAANENATYAEVMDVQTKLMVCITTVNMQAGDKEALGSLIDSCTYFTDETLAANYVEAEQAEYKAALADANKVYADGDAFQENVDKARDDLFNAVSALRMKANKSALQALLNQVNGIDLSLYSEESIALLHTAMENVNSVLANEALSVDDQATVDKAVKTLQAAVDGLELKQPAETPETPADPTDPNKSTDPSDNSAGSESSKAGTTSKTSAKTGDASPMAGAAVLVLAAGAAVVLIKRRKK